MNRIKKLSFLFLSVIIFITSFSKIYGIEDIKLTTIKKGDVIYYDNSKTKWENVKIYLFEKKDGSEDSGAFEWNDNKGQMNKIDDTDIWEYTLPDDITSNKYNHVIFTNNGKNGNNQTIDLGYLGKGYAYISEGTDSSDQNKQKGYWYLYDKTELRNLLDECKKLEEKYYTSESWATFKTSMEEAQSVLDGEQKIESTDIEGVYKCDYFYKLENLQTAKDDLKVDKEILNNKIKETQNIDKDKYTPDSVNKLNEAVKNAQGKYNGEDPLTVDGLKDELSKLDEAINNLKPNKDKLKEKIDEGNGIIDNEDSKYYTNDSVNALKDKVKNGNEVYKNDNATLAEVEKATDEMDGAIKGLELNKKMLEDLINMAKNADFDKYTDETVEALKGAINASQDLLGSGEITLEKFKNSIESLNSAINGLVEKQGNVNENINNNTQTPSTGSSILLAIILLSVGAIVLLITFVFIKKGPKKNKN